MKWPTIRFHSLPFKLSLYISLTLLGVSILGLSFIGWRWFTDMSAALNFRGHVLAQETAHKLDAVFVQAQQAAHLLANALEQHPCSREGLADRLKMTALTVNAQCPEICAVVIAYQPYGLDPNEKYNAQFAHIDKNGTYIPSTWSDSSSAVNYFILDWFVIPTTLDRPVWTIPFWAHTQQQTIVAYSIPFHKTVNGVRTVAGVVTIDIPIRALEAHMPAAQFEKDTNLAKSGTAFICNQFGQIVIHDDTRDDTNGRTLYTLCDEVDTPDPADRRSAQSISHAPYGKIRLNNTLLLKTTRASELFYAHCVNDWTVCIAIPANWLQKMLTPIAIRFGAGCILVIIFIIAIIFTITKRVNQPLITLANATRNIGRGDFTSVIPEVTSDDEIGNLSASFHHMQHALTDYITRLKSTVAAKERAEGELNVAKMIQHDILPKILPPFIECPNVEGSADLIAARGVGGDMYDVFLVNPDTLALIIGDVSGKGVPAALFMAVTETLQRSLCHADIHVDVLATQLNRMLSAQNAASMFVTYWAGFLNIRTGTLTYTNAGHNPPLIRRATGELDEISARHGPPLAILENHTYRASTLTMAPGDVLVLYTDGVTEATNANETLYGFEPLKALVKNAPDTTPATLLRAIEADVARFTDGFEQSDDITLLLLKYITEPSRETLTVAATDENLATVMAFAEKHLSTCGFSTGILNKLLVSVEEIYVNIAHYAYAPATGDATITYWKEAGQARLMFTDSGVAYNPLARTDPDITLNVTERPIGGLGILLVKKSVDFIDYRRESECNMLTIGKTIDF